MFVGGAVAVLVLALAVIGAKKLIRSGQSAAAQSAAAESTVEETALKTAVTINDVDITGMSRMEARKCWSRRERAMSPIRYLICSA